MFGQKNYLQVTKKKVQHIFIFLMEKYSRQFHITMEKKKDYQKNMIKKEIL